MANFLKYSLEALNLKRELHNGNEHVDVSNSLLNVSNAYYLMKDYKNALKCSLESLKIRENLLKSHSDTFISLVQVGKTYGFLEDYKNAVLYLEKALKMKTDLVKSNGKNNIDAYLTDIDIENELSKAKKKLLN